MSPPVLEKILILQERDARRAGLESQLRLIPRDIEAVEQKIAAERSALQEAREELRHLEVKRNALHTEISATEERVVRYKNQQMQVKKNEEYQALSHEIDTAQQAASALEEDEIRLLFSMDEAKATARTAEARLNSNIAGYQERIVQLKERETNLRAELAGVQEQVSAARQGIDEAALRTYDRLMRGLGVPICVPLHEHKCGGCHLKVSSGVVQEVFRGEKLTPCDNCGRILYSVS